MRDAGIPTPDFFAFNETAFKSLGVAQALPAISSRLQLPARDQAGQPGLGAGIKFARSAADVPTALIAAFSYDRKVLLERYIAGRELAVSVLEHDGAPRALPIVEAVPEQEDFYDFEARYEIGRTRFVCPAELDSDVTQRAQELALEAFNAARLLELRPSRPDARRRHLRALRARGQPDPRPHRDLLLPQAADAAGIGFDDLIARIVTAAS